MTFKRGMKMRRRLIIVIVVFLALAAIDVYRSMGNFNTVTYRVWKACSPYNRVRQGMTEQQVESLLGKPDSIVPNPNCEWWIYAVRPPVGEQDPSRAYVNFGPDGRVTSIVPESADYLKHYWPKGRPKPGMTKQQVQLMIGKPDDTGKREWVTYWNYNLWNRSKAQVTFGRDGKVCWARAVASHVDIKW